MRMTQDGYVMHLPKFERPSVSSQITLCPYFLPK